jgi:hypothetical protein
VARADVDLAITIFDQALTEMKAVLAKRGPLRRDVAA